MPTDKHKTHHMAAPAIFMDTINPGAVRAGGRLKAFKLPPKYSGAPNNSTPRNVAPTPRRAPRMKFRPAAAAPADDMTIEEDVTGGEVQQPKVLHCIPTGYKRFDKHKPQPSLTFPPFPASGPGLSNHHTTQLYSSRMRLGRSSNLPGLSRALAVVCHG